MPDHVLQFVFRDREYEIRAATDKPAMCIYDILDIVGRVQHVERSKRGESTRVMWARLTHNDAPFARELRALAFDAPIRKCARIRRWQDLPCIPYAGAHTLLAAVKLELRRQGLVEGTKKVEKALAAQPASDTHATDERRAAAAEERSTLVHVDASLDADRLKKAEAAVRAENLTPITKNKQQRKDIAAELAAATSETALSSALAAAAAAYAVHRRRVADKGRGRDDANTVAPPQIDYNKMYNEKANALRAAAATAAATPKINHAAIAGERCRALAAAGDDPALIAAFHAKYPAAPVQKAEGPRNINHDLIEHVRVLLHRLEAGDASALKEIGAGLDIIDEPTRKKQKTQSTLAQDDLVLHLPRDTVVFGAKHTYEKKNLQTNTSTTETVQVFSILALIKLNSDLARTPYCYNYARNLWKHFLTQNLLPSHDIFQVSIKCSSKTKRREITPATTISQLRQVWHAIKIHADNRSGYEYYKGKRKIDTFEPMDQKIYSEFMDVLFIAGLGDHSIIKFT